MWSPWAGFFSIGTSNLKSKGRSRRFSPSKCVFSHHQRDSCIWNLILYNTEGFKVSYWGKSPLNWPSPLFQYMQISFKQLSLLVLKKIKNYLPYESIIIYYNAYILPLMDYCDTIWGNTTQYNINRIVKLQKRAARTIITKHMILLLVHFLRN